MLDDEYSPSRLVPSLQAYLDDYAARSAAVRAAHPVRTDVRYGPAAAETLDLFPGTGDALHVFVHGGNWQALGKGDSAFPAPPFLAAGAGFVAVDYGLAPATSLDEMVASIRRCLRWLHREHPDARIFLSGTSAGAHLAAMAVIDVPVAGVTLLSGMYDLDAVRRSYVNDALRLDEAGARRNSPHLHLPDTLPPVVIARGGTETAEYVRHHDLMAAALRTRTDVVDLVVGHRNHFDLPDDLGVPGTALGDAVRAQMGL
jgi:arylformamidase